MMLPAESGTHLPHRPWTPMSLREWEGPASEAQRGDGAKRKSVRKRLPLRGRRCGSIGKPLPRGKPLRHHRGVTAGRDGAKHHREAASQRKARHLRGEQPAEPAPSRRASCRTSSIGKQLHSAKQGAIGGATCRTSSIGKSTFCQIMVPKGQVLRG